MSNPGYTLRIHVEALEAGLLSAPQELLGCIFRVSDDDVLWNPVGRGRRGKDRKLICSDVQGAPPPVAEVRGVPSPVGDLQVGDCGHPIGTPQRCELAAKSLKKKYIGIMMLGAVHLGSLRSGVDHRDHMALEVLLVGGLFVHDRSCICNGP